MSITCRSLRSSKVRESPDVAAFMGSLDSIRLHPISVPVGPRAVQRAAAFVSRFDVQVHITSQIGKASTYETVKWNTCRRINQLQSRYFALPRVIECVPMAGIQDRERAHDISPQQAASIRAELDTILASPGFSSSKRCHDFLKCIVEHVLAGDYDQLNERFLGVELFGRKVDFDTGADSIVRVRASDVRRRLAQYYSERSSPPAVTIGLSSGNYVPTFQWPSVEVAKINEAVAPRATQEETPSVPTDPSRDERGLLKPLSIVIALLVVTAMVVAAWNFWPLGRTSALEQFWRPFLQNKRMVTICFPDSHLYWISPDLRQKVEDNQPSILVRPGDIVKASSGSGGTAMGDVRGVIGLAGFLTSRGLATQALWPQEGHEIELERTNAIYIGAFNNVWTMNLTRNLRFFFDVTNSGQKQIWGIRDRLHPDKLWTTEKTASQQADRSYALITRIIAPDRSRVQMAIGGIDEFGTEAACEFLTDGNALSDVVRSAPRGWQKRNLEIVLEMDISGNVVVNPKVIAIQAW